jgi:hypothetical protein
MSQSPTQRTTGSTRFKGPAVITLRGAGSKGKDYTLGGVAPVGAGLDVGLSIQVPTGQVANMLQFEEPDSGNATGNPPVAAVPANIITAFDAAGGLLLTSVPLSSQRMAQATLTAAQIIAMYTTPVAIVPAPAAGLAIVVSQITFEMKATATAFTGGGIVVFQFANTAHGAGTLVHAGSIPASVVNAGAAGNTLTGLWAASGANGLTIPTATGIFISNQTGVFATGTGTAIVTISYDLVTLG